MSGVAVKVSSSLAQEARKVAKWSDRSVAGQIEHWAKLGQAVDTALSAPAAAALKKSGGKLDIAFDNNQERKLVLDLLASLRTSMPQARIAAKIRAGQAAVYESDPQDFSRIIRVSEDGKRTRGKMIGRKFVAM